MPQGVDKRILRSRRALLRALPIILCEKPLDRITVREIAEVAGINRKTFYAHYAAPEDLHNDLADKVVDAVLHRMDGHHANRLADFTAAMSHILNDYRREFSLFLTSANMFSLRTLVFDRLRHALAPILFPSNPHGDMLAAGVIGTTLALYSVQLSSDNPLPQSAFEELHLCCLCRGLA